MPWKVGLARGPQSSTLLCGESESGVPSSRRHCSPSKSGMLRYDMPDMLLSLGYVLQILKLESWNILNMFALRAGVEGHRSNADDG